MVTDDMLRAIEALQSRKEYKNLTGSSKTIVDYLLSEVKDAVKDNKLAVKKNFSRQKSIPLFEIRFSYHGVYISTLYKFASSHIKCIKDYKKTDMPAVVDAIETVGAILGWNVDLDREIPHQLEREMKIGYKIPETANPWGARRFCFGI